MKKHLYKALQSHFTAEMDSAKATLEVYFNSAAGIGEHPQVVEEMVKQVEKLTNAEDCLHSVQTHLKKHK